MNKNAIKNLCTALVVTGILAFSMVAVFASENNHIDTETKTGFTPSGDSTWGDLYRYYDPEGFSDLSPAEKQFYDGVSLGSDKELPKLMSNSTFDDAIASYMEEHGKEDYVSVYAVIQPEES